MIVKANAKINLGLYITGLNKDKYHLLDATMIPISLYDEIDIIVNNKNEDEVIFDKIGIPKNNTITKAINLLRERYKFNQYFDIKVKKNIPDGAGLGGGSSDAAFVMKSIKEILNLKVDEKEFMDIALKVGADVPFFLVNKPCRMQGIGEKLTPFNINGKYLFLLIKPIDGVSTIEAYKKYDELIIKHKNNVEEIINALEKNKELINIKNELFEVAKVINTQIIKLEKEVLEFSPKVLTMSGSGSTLVVYDEIDKLQTIKNKLEKNKEIEYIDIVSTI